MDEHATACLSWVSKLNELVTPQLGTFQFRAAAGEVQLEVRLQSVLQPRVYYGRGAGKVGREEAARAAVEDPELVEEVSRLRLRPPAPRPQCINNASQALEEYCKKKKVSREEDYLVLAGRVRCSLALRRAGSRSLAACFESPPCGSKSDAREAAALIALSDLARSDPAARSLLSAIPRGNLHLGSADRSHNGLPLLLSPQVRGRPLRDENGFSLSESRGLEFKALAPGTETDTAADCKRILDAYLHPPKEKCLGFYLSAFLNAGIAGRIVFGVLDNGEVMGFPVSQEDEDKFLRAFDEVLRRFYPALTIDSGIVRKPLFLPVTVPIGQGPVIGDLKIIVIETNPPAAVAGPAPVYFWHPNAFPAIKWEASATTMTPAQLVQRLAAAPLPS